MRYFFTYYLFILTNKRWSFSKKIEQKQNQFCIEQANPPSNFGRRLGIQNFELWAIIFCRKNNENPSASFRALNCLKLYIGGMYCMVVLYSMYSMYFMGVCKYVSKSSPKNIVLFSETYLKSILWFNLKQIQTRYEINKLIEA